MNVSRNFRLWLALSAALAAVALVTAAESRRSNGAKTAAKSAPTATTATVAPARGFDAFEIVVERNIFNPNRVGRTRAAADEKVVRVDEISLVGTVQHDQQNLALFDSPDAAFRKAVREGEIVGEFTVQRITAGGAELRRGDQPFALKVAQQLRREEGGDWSVATNQAARSDPRALAATDATAARPAAAATSAAELPAETSEVLQRLMKKREKQLNK